MSDNIVDLDKQKANIDSILSVWDEKLQMVKQLNGKKVELNIC